MTNLAIRSYESGDEERVRAIGSRLAEGFASWRSPGKVHETIAGWIDSALSQADAAGRIVLVAVDDEAGIVGFVAATVQVHYIDGRDAYIGELAVDEAHGRRGIARVLIEHIETWARNNGCDRLTLQTGAANAGARSFYEKLAFQYEDVSLAREIT